MVMAAGRQITVQAPWPGLLPDGGLRRGSTVVVSGDVGFGVLSVVWSLMAGPTQRGHWTALVGIDDPGVVALEKDQKRLGDMSLLLIGIRSPDRQANVRYAEALTKKLRALPKTTVELAAYNIRDLREFFEKNKST